MYIPELVYIVHMWPVGPILDVRQNWPLSHAPDVPGERFSNAAVDPRKKLATSRKGTTSPRSYSRIATLHLSFESLRHLIHDPAIVQIHRKSYSMLQRPTPPPPLRMRHDLSAISQPKRASVQFPLPRSSAPPSLANASASIAFGVCRTTARA